MRSLILASAVVALSACGGGGGGSNRGAENIPPTPTTRSVTLQFAAEANGQALTCDSALSGLGTSAASGKLRDFRFYVHNVRLIKADNTEVSVTLDGNEWQSSGVALLDFQNKSDNCGGSTKPTHTALTGNVTEGDYVGVAFTVGLPESLNHQNQTAAASPMNIASLFWSWQAGYKFMRFDVAPDGGITRPTDVTFAQTTFNFHLGSTDCTGLPQNQEAVTCSRINRPDVRLDNFNVSTQQILLNYGALISEIDITQDISGAPGCMSGLSDQECQSMFTQLGLDFTAGTPSTALTQTVFSVRNP